MPDVDLRQLAIDRSDADGPSIHPRRHLLTRYVLPLLLIVGFLLLLVWSAWDLIFPPHRVTVEPVISTAAEFRQAGTPMFEASGWVEPRPTPVRVPALAPGVVEKLHVVEDQLLKAGDPIAELVAEDAQLALDEAKVNLKLRKAELDEAKATLTAAETHYNQPVHLQAALGEAEAPLARIKTQLAKLPFEVRQAEADYDALKKDYDSKQAARAVVIGIEIDIAKSKAESAQAIVEELAERSESLKKERTALVQRRDALKTQLKLRADETKSKDAADARVRVASARVAQARVAVETAQLQFDRMSIVSPIDGRVYRLIAHPGARIGSGMTQMKGHDGSTVVTLYRPEMLQVRVDVRFENMLHIKGNEDVTIRNAAFKAPLSGKVLFISSEADIQLNTLQIKVAIENPPSVCKPEMLVKVTFLSQESRDESQESEKASESNRIFVPQQLVVSEDDETYIWVADQSARVARKQKIKVGLPSGNGLIEVTHGLNISSRLITKGRDSLTDGCRIRINKESP